LEGAVQDVRRRRRVRPGARDPLREEVASRGGAKAGRARPPRDAGDSVSEREHSPLGRPVSDEAARRHAVEATTRSLLVEASAGTGKTHTLVSRILRLVIEGGVPLSRLAAVTFTEKAAGEMKE